MRSIPTRWTWLLALLPALVTVGSTWGAAPTEMSVVRAGSELDFRPYCFTEKDGQPAGFGPDLLRAVADRMGLPLRITAAPWDKVWSDLIASNLDVLPVVARTPGREPLVDFSLPHTETFDAFFVREGRPPIKDLAAATGKEIVVLRSDAAHHQLVERRFAGKIIPVESIPDGLRLIAAGRHDAFLCSKLIGVLELKQSGIKGVESGPLIPDYKRVFSFAVHKGNADLVEKLNQGLLMVKTDGTYDRIYRCWLSVEDPWRKWTPYFQWAVVTAIILATLVLVLQWLVRHRTRQLTTEAAERQKAEAALQELNATLEQRVAERTVALHESEARMQQALLVSQSFTFEWRPATDAVERSESCAVILGLTGAEVIADTGQRYFQRVHPDDRARFVETLRALSPANPTYQTEYRLVRGDGGEVVLQETGAATFDAAGKLVRLVGVTADVTARKQAEAALAAAHQQLQSVIDNTTSMVYACDLEARFVMANATLAALLQTTPAQMLGKRRHEFMPQEDADRHEANDREVMAVGRAVEFEEQSELPGRSITWLSTKFPLRDAQGRIYAVAGIVTDISARKQAEEALRQSEERFRTLANTIPQLAWWANPDGYITWYNDNWYKYTGTTPQQMEGWGWQSVHDPVELPNVLERWKGSLATGEPFEMVFPLRGADGKFRQFLTRGWPLKDAQGRVLQWFGTNTDVDELKRAEDALARRGSILAGINQVFECALVAHTEEEFCEATLGVMEAVTGSKISFIGEIGPDGCLHDLAISNPGWDACKMYDRTGHRKPPGNFPVHGIYGRVLIDGKSLIVNEPASHPDRIGLPEGHPPLTAFLGVPLMRDGKLVGMIAVGNRDGGYRAEDQLALETLAPAMMAALDRKRSEAVLRKTVVELERSNEELEQFAYVSAHDLQEPLRQVRAFIGMLKDRHADKLDGKAAEYFGYVYEGAARMSELVRGLLEYSRVGSREARHEPVPCQQALDAALSNLQTSIAESKARITHDNLPTIVAEPTQLAQLFQNLIGNALKFHRDGVPPEIHVGARRDGNRWLLSVRDNGIGIAPEFHENVFVIFQRLHGRETYPGTGIGLAICKKIVEQHGGKIWIESKVAQGSTFYFTLPEVSVG